MFLVKFIFTPYLEKPVNPNQNEKNNPVFAFNYIIRPGVFTGAEN